MGGAFLDAEDDDNDGNGRRRDGDPQHGPDVVRHRRHEDDGEQRADERADGVEGLPEPVTGAAQVGRRDVGDQRIARGAANAFADSVDGAGGENPTD